ncbi:MAG TPA: alpha-L-arabinofuranosidase C-terminal domain-containing protein, partial [Spirochaetia bacterium]|nr:alpha-L-arabinofuranosidase C-terminal domain-containing protein [Spirochaetia bacterium]
FGTHEFFELCELIGAEPYICGNISTGTPQEMLEWLEYLNYGGHSELADLRKANGRELPFGLKYFGVGNENWGCGGRMKPEYYADVYRRYQNHAKSFGPEPLFKIACGPKNDDYHWTEVLMREAGHYMDGLALHYYTRFFSSGENKEEYRGSATDFNEDEWFLALKKALYTEEIVTRHSSIMDQYDSQKRVALIVDEWGTWFGVEPGTDPSFLFQQNTMRDALVAAMSLNIFNNHAERVRMANIAQTVNVLQAMVLTDREQMLLTPSYHVYAMYASHQGARLLRHTLQCGDYSYGGESIPALNVSVSKGNDASITVSFCNNDPNATQPVACEVRGGAYGKAEGSVLSGKSINAHNTFAAPDEVKPAPFKGISRPGGAFQFDLPPMSVVVLTLSGK